ncbi:class I adenylate-forming enzyme family protein [Nocardia sp. XZ_19_385]|uniref:class I adenylate-forming enzyme family protein n=1 Tax=Nocardia sp. XZ_19_385 TaxID=2769488 RepID=UPI00188EDC71|nr:class I adenylate-forming enzyme family protein [Nocardia sp. XZ_19_385]
MPDQPLTTRDPQADSRGVTRCHPEERVRDYLDKGWWQPETMLDVFDSWVQRRPDAAALTDPSNLAALTGALPEELTWQQLHDRVERTAAALYANGIRQADVVAVLVPNSVALVASYLALWRLGAVATPMPVSYRGHEISTIVAASGAVAIITVDTLQDRALAQEVSGLGLRTVFTFTPGTPASLHPDAAADPAPMREYVAALEITINDRITICWTSGTEAAPKGVPRCHADWLAIGWGPQEGLETSTESVILNPFPLVNMAGFAGSLLPWLLGGGQLVQHHPLDLPVFLGQIQKYGVTHTSMPPALLTMLLQREDLRGLADLSSLQKVGSGGAPLPPSVVRDWQENFGIAVLNFFGSNEGVCLMGAPADIPDPVLRAQHLPNYSTRSRTWASRLAGNTAVRLVDPATGELVHAVGGQGELRLKGPSVFGGYLPGTATSEPFDADGFLCSGDVFELCGADGQYLRFVDRIKEIIIRGGMNIAPAEIEGLLLDHPAIAEVAVVGFPDPVLGEKCCAIVVPKPGASITLGEVTDHLRARDIASFKLPERLELASALPRNPVGKILRRQLRDELSEQG